VRENDYTLKITRYQLQKHINLYKSMDGHPDPFHVTSLEKLSYVLLLVRIEVTTTTKCLD